ncbi:MAG: thioredoxin [Desulfatiglandaceae bacterium]
MSNILLKCANCGAKNKVPRDRLGDRPVCGKCRALLPVGAVHETPVDISDQTFESEVISYPGPVVVDAWAPWCGPCKMVGPILEELAKTYAGRVKIAKLNVDENPITASKYAIRSIPTMFFFKNGEMVNSTVGALPREEIERHLQAIL